MGKKQEHEIYELHKKHELQNNRQFKYVCASPTNKNAHKAARALRSHRQRREILNKQQIMKRP